MDTFFDNSIQTGLMRDIAVEMEILGEHLILLGNQGVGKNKIMDRYDSISFILLHNQVDEKTGCVNFSAALASIYNSTAIRLCRPFSFILHCNLE
jgi:hypothetical protein